MIDIIAVLALAALVVALWVVAQKIKARRIPREFYVRQFRVQDGDSLIAPENKHIRLLCIDAPEIGQSHGVDAKIYLAKLVKDGGVVFAKDTDQYGRLLAIVVVDMDGKQVIVNHEMLRQGHAWVYRKFSDSCGLSENSLYAIERKARKEKRGLWQAQKPTPPWQWRYDNRQ